MNTIKPGKNVLLIVRSHVESTNGGKLRVVRLEPSKEGKRLLTTKSTNISADEFHLEKRPIGKSVK